MLNRATDVGGEGIAARGRAEGVLGGLDSGSRRVSPPLSATPLTARGTVASANTAERVGGAHCHKPLSRRQRRILLLLHISTSRHRHEALIGGTTVAQAFQHGSCAHFAIHYPSPTITHSTHNIHFIVITSFGMFTPLRVRFSGHWNGLRFKGVRFRASIARGGVLE